ncbi:hypothetical protein ACFT7U_21065 [Streptomyces rochei]|uniref:hypothetical protein n=1 Tax=Streptomyces rochei TaxID=1928 RepID=UPI00364417AF
MTDTPWYMRPADPGAIQTNDPERKRKHLEQIASTASAEADAMVSRLKAAEAQGVQVTPSMRIAMGYVQTARLAAAQLGDQPQHSTNVSAEGITPEQRIARGYGSSN